MSLSRVRRAKGERRWELLPHERERLDTPPSRRELASAFARAHLRSPRLVAQTARSAIGGAVQGVRADQSLPWILHDERARSVSPDVGSHATAHGLEVLMEALEPRLGADARVLELGCGGGRVARLVSEAVSELVCADVSQVMLSEARRALAARANVSFQRTHGLELASMGDGSFDVVYAHDVFVTFDPNPMLALLDEGARVLRPGGSFVASFYTIDRPAWAREQLALVRRGRRWGAFGASYPRPYVSGQIDALFETVGLTVRDRRYGAYDEDSSGRAHYVVVAERSPGATEQEGAGSSRRAAGS